MDKDMFPLTSFNYTIWKPRMEQLLSFAELYDTVKGHEAKPPGMSEKDWALLGREAVSLILRWIDDTVFHLVSMETDAHSLWMKTESLFGSNPHMKKANSIRELVDLRYKDGDSMNNHLNNFRNIVNDLNSSEVVLPDELQACLFLATLPREEPAKSMEVDGKAGRLKEDDYLLKYSWFFSTRYPFHFCSNRYWFDTFQESRGESVTLINNSRLEVEGIGNVKVKMYDGKIRTFGEVRYVPKYISNVISVGRLMSSGSDCCTAGSSTWEVRKGDSVTMKGDSVELGLYKLTGRTVVPGSGDVAYIL